MRSRGRSLETNSLHRSTSLLTDFFFQCSEIDLSLLGENGMERTRIHLVGKVMQGTDGDLWVVNDSRYESLIVRVTYKLLVWKFQIAVCALFHHLSNPAELMNRSPIEAVNNFDPMKTRRSTSVSPPQFPSASCPSFC